MEQSAQRLIDAAKNLLNWLPMYSEGSVGHARVEKLKEAITNIEKPSSVSAWGFSEAITVLPKSLYE